MIRPGVAHLSFSAAFPPQKAAGFPFWIGGTAVVPYLNHYAVRHRALSPPHGIQPSSGVGSASRMRSRGGLGASLRVAYCPLSPHLSRRVVAPLIVPISGNGLNASTYFQTSHRRPSRVIASVQRTASKFPQSFQTPSIGENRLILRLAARCSGAAF